MIETVREHLGHLGHYEGLTAFDVWLCEHVDDCAEETTGETDWHGWYALCGRRVVTVDSLGFHYVARFTSAAKALLHFDRIAEEYAEWLNEEEETTETGERACPTCGRACATGSYYCPVHAGGLRDEVRDAVLWAPGAE